MTDPAKKVTVTRIENNVQLLCVYASHRGSVHKEGKTIIHRFVIADALVEIPAELIESMSVWHEGQMLTVRPNKGVGQ